MLYYTQNGISIWEIRAYDDEQFRGGGRKVYAPQNTHPHRTFGPDGRRVVFASDRTCVSQV